MFASYIPLSSEISPSGARVGKSGSFLPLWVVFWYRLFPFHRQLNTCMTARMSSVNSSFGDLSLWSRTTSLTSFWSHIQATRSKANLHSRSLLATTISCTPPRETSPRIDKSPFLLKLRPDPTSVTILCSGYLSDRYLDCLPRSSFCLPELTLQYAILSFSSFGDWICLIDMSFVFSSSQNRR